MQKFKLNFLHLCDSAFFSQEGKLNIIGIFDLINIKEVPGILNKAVLVGNFSLLDFTDNKLVLKVTIVDEEGNETEQPKVPPLEISVPTPKPKNFGFILELGNIKFNRLGNYKLRVETEQGLLGEVIFTVKKIERKRKD